MNNINTKALTTIGVSADYIMSLSENVKLKKYLIEYPKFTASVPIRRMCEQLISSGSGVYFFHDLRGIHYIGETSDLKSRFKSHIKREKNKKLVKVMKSAFGEMNFSWVKTSSKMEALIYQIPSCSIQIGIKEKSDFELLNRGVIFNANTDEKLVLFINNTIEPFKYDINSIENSLDDIMNFIELKISNEKI